MNQDLPDKPPVPPAGWPGAMLRAELSNYDTELDAAHDLLWLARKLLVGVGGEYQRGAPPMVAWPHQEPSDVLAEYRRRLRQGAADELLIDGQLHYVNHAVRAYVLRLVEHNRSLAAAAGKLQARIDAHEAGAPPMPEHGRWTASTKAEVVRAIRGGHLDRAKALQLYAMDESELQQWEAATPEVQP